MEKKKAIDEKQVIQRKLAKKLEAKDAQKKKEVDRKNRRIKKANELFQRVTFSRDKQGGELIIKPHKFPRNLPLRHIPQMVFMIPFIFFLAIFTLPNEETLSPFMVWILRITAVTAFWLFAVYFVGHKDMHTLRIRIAKDGNFYVYRRNPHKPIAYGKKNDFHVETYKHPGSWGWGNLDLKYHGRGSGRFEVFSFEDLNRVESFCKKLDL